MSTKGFGPWFRRKLNGALNRIAQKRWCHVDWWETWMFNLRCFDLRTALKRPVYIYNNVQIITLGKVILDAKDIHKGMIRIGFWPMKAHGKTKIRKGGTIIFHGNVDIWGGCMIEGGGVLEFGDNVTLGESCKIMNNDYMTFQDHVRVGYEVTFMDTDYHYILNMDDNTVHRNTGEVVIGEGSWISSTCKIMKGTHIPPKSVVGGGSLVNRDFSKEAPCQIYVGSPAKPVKGNRRRIFNVKAEAEANRYFKEHPDEKTLVMNVGEDTDEFCYSNFWGNR